MMDDPAPSVIPAARRVSDKLVPLRQMVRRRLPMSGHKFEDGRLVPVEINWPDESEDAIKGMAHD